MYDVLRVVAKLNIELKNKQEQIKHPETKTAHIYFSSHHLLVSLSHLGYISLSLSLSISI
jgi:hypothetical protein